MSEIDRLKDKFSEAAGEFEEEGDFEMAREAWKSVQGLKDIEEGNTVSIEELKEKHGID